MSGQKWSAMILAAHLLAVVCWMLWGVPFLLRLPADFSYKVDVISLDDVADPTGAFQGPKRSLTNFSYGVRALGGATMTVVGTVDVRTLTGKRIYSTERSYLVDRRTRRFVAAEGEPAREGQLFAPPRLREGQSFIYWHPNYDVPATMRFVRREKLRGVTVFRYETGYEGMRVDQTRDLAGIVPGVGETLGIEVRPFLQLWVDPVTGHLIKYADEATAYFYDLQTMKRLRPWNRFSNVVTNESAIAQLEAAGKERRWRNALERGVPAALGASALLFFLLATGALRKMWALLPIAALLVLWSAFPVDRGTPTYEGPVQSIRMGLNTGLLSAPAWIAHINGYFREAGVDVKPTKYSSGRAALEALLQGDTLDVAAVAQTPFVFHSFSRRDFSLLGAMVTASNDTKLLVRRDHGIAEPADLAGKRIGVTLNSTAHYFLGLYLAQHGLSLDEVKVVDLEASEIVEAIREGRVDAIASWEPYIHDARRALPKQSMLLKSDGTFREDFYLVVPTEWARQNRGVLERFLAAVDRGAAFIRDHPDEAGRLLVDHLKLDPEFVSSQWKEYEYGLLLDQSVVLSLEQQARWMTRRGMVRPGAPINYLDYIFFDPLESVSPEAVNIIH